MTITITRVLRCIERRMDGPASFIMAGNQMQVERPEDIVYKKNKDR